MATYVIDASVVIERLIQGPYTLHARALFRRAFAGDQFIVPEFCLLECTNVLWKHVRFQGMLPDHARLLLRDLRALPLRRIPIKAALNEAFDIGLSYQLAIYDSAYVALAKRSGCSLVTVDQPQIRAAAAEGIVLMPITDFK